MDTGEDAGTPVPVSKIAFHALSVCVKQPTERWALQVLAAEISLAGGNPGQAEQVLGIWGSGDEGLFQRKRHPWIDRIKRLLVSR